MLPFGQIALPPYPVSKSDHSGAWAGPSVSASFSLLMALVGQVIRSSHIGFPLRRTATTQMRADKGMGDGVAPPPNTVVSRRSSLRLPMLALHI